MPSSAGRLAASQPTGGAESEGTARQKAEHRHDRWRNHQKLKKINKTFGGGFLFWSSGFCRCCGGDLLLPFYLCFDSNYFYFHPLLPQVSPCTASCSRARSPAATDDRKATRGPSCRSAGPTGVSACNRILTEVYSGKGQQPADESMPDTEQGPINFSVIEPRTCERIVCGARNAQLWRRLGFCLLSSTSVGLFSSVSPPSPPSWLHTHTHIPTVVRPHSLHTTDATERFHWQIAFSRWFFNAPVAF